MLPPVGVPNNDWGIPASNMTKKKREILGVALEVRGEGGVTSLVAFSLFLGRGFPGCRLEEGPWGVSEGDTGFRRGTPWP